MKACIHHFRGTRRAFRPGVLVLLGWSLASSISSAATITWTGAGGDDLWSNPTNWNGGALPTPDDDVVIDVPGTITVRMDGPWFTTTAVRSLQCAESFHLETGSFRVTAGSSVINGAFHANSYLSLGAHGVSTVLTLNGAVTNIGGGLSAESGSVIALPTTGQLTVGIYDGFQEASSLFASGVGSAILMTNLTNLVIAPFDYFNVAASGGARIDLRRLPVTDGPIVASAENPDSLVDLSGLSGLWAQGPEHTGGAANSLAASDGGTVLIPNVTACDKVTLTVNGSANVPLAQVRSFTRGALNVTSRTNDFGGLTNFSGTITASDARLDLTNLTVLHGANGFLNVAASQGSFIDLSRVTNAVADPWFGISVSADSGGRIDLRRMRLPDGPFAAAAADAGSMVDLSGLNGEWASPASAHRPSGVTATSGGIVLISNVTSMRYLSLDLRSDAVVPTTQLRSFTDGSIALLSRTNGFEGLTNFTGSISVTDARLDLTNFTVLSVASGSVYLWADQGSVIDLSRVTNLMDAIPMSGYGLSVSAQGGSRIDLSGLASDESPVSATAGGAGSLIDLSGLNGRWRSGSLSASADATISIPNLTDMEGVTLTVSDSANVDLAQIGSFTDGWLTLTSRTNDFLGLTNFAGTAIGVADSYLILTNVTTLYTTNKPSHISANHGSVIDLSRVTNWVSSGWPLYVYAYNGSRVDLSRLPTPESPLHVDARGAGSVVELSGLNGLWSGGGGVTAHDGATVPISNVTAMENIVLDLRGDANVPTAQLRSFTAGNMYLELRTNVFTELTNFTGGLSCSSGRAEFPALTQLNATNYAISLVAGSEGIIDLSPVTNVIGDSSSALSLYAVSGGRIDLPLLESILTGYASVQADGAGSTVDLRGLTGLFSDNNGGSLSTRNGGTILLNNDAMLLAGVAVDFQSNPGDLLPTFVAPSQSLVLYGRPWRSYRIESRNPAEAGSPWQLYQRVALTDALWDLGRRPPSDLALRVYAFEADPPEVDIRRGVPGTVEAILFGVPGGTYQLESRITLHPPGDWENHSTVTLTNSFAIFPAATAAHDTRFFRAVKP